MPLPLTNGHPRPSHLQKVDVATKRCRFGLVITRLSRSGSGAVLRCGRGARAPPPDSLVAPPDSKASWNEFQAIDFKCWSILSSYFFGIGERIKWTR